MVVYWGGFKERDIKTGEGGRRQMAMEASTVRRAVRERYGSKAVETGGCCGPSACGCAEEAEATTAQDISRAVGYQEGDLASVPDGANLGLGCGNPVALASLSPGDTVVDLGSGAGFVCFLAADRVGPDGRVLGVDMTPEMIERARANAEDGGYANVEFRLGEIEALPVGDGMADAVISNCVLNLSPDRPRVLAEALRVLKPGGRLMISDLVSARRPPEFIASSKEALVGCLPVMVSEYERDLSQAGFAEVRVEQGSPYPADHIFGDPQVQAVVENDPRREAEARAFAGSIHGGTIQAVKPGG